ncbi:MAG: RsmD family RNA methyltransferase [Planctomycetaceae bacterium]|jgi:16S rRNA (guanine966-N2)-methyltransferase|nr:RsmD family RNA methyltransferase [Planctomycetaceae bacterium]
MKNRNIGSQPATKEPVGLRIIGGRFRGSKLLYTGDNRVRPMKDRVRESVFNLIGPGIKGTHVIDLFGGTGAAAIEAVSRGAAAATVIEIHLPTAFLLQKNIESLHLSGICKLQKTDAFYWVKNRQEHPKDGIPMLVFCCPPYDFYHSRKDEMLELIGSLYEEAPPESLFVIEADDRFDFATLPVPAEQRKQRSYPPAEIAVFSK